VLPNASDLLSQQAASNSVECGHFVDPATACKRRKVPQTGYSATSVTTGTTFAASICQYCHILTSHLCVYGVHSLVLVAV